MLRMQDFHKLIFPASKATDSYFTALNQLTKASRDQMSTLESDLSWQEWGAENQKTVARQA
jgi:hypothetical protein